MPERLGMLIDLKKCISCQACTVACKVHNKVPLGRFVNRVLKVGPEGNFPHLGYYGLPAACMQCTDPPCVDVCPTKASAIAPNGVIMIDDKKCVGCRYCMAACPYGARVFNEERRVVQKCTFCFERRERGRQPICVQTCVGGARYFGDLNDPQAEVSRLIHERHAENLLPDLNTQPGVFYCRP